MTLQAMFWFTLYVIFLSLPTFSAMSIIDLIYVSDCWTCCSCRYQSNGEQYHLVLHCLEPGKLPEVFRIEKLVYLGAVLHLLCIFHGVLNGEAVKVISPINERYSLPVFHMHVTANPFIYHIQNGPSRLSFLKFFGGLCQFVYQSRVLLYLLKWKMWEGKIESLTGKKE